MSGEGRKISHPMDIWKHISGLANIKAFKFFLVWVIWVFMIRRLWIVCWAEIFILLSLEEERCHG